MKLCSAEVSGYCVELPSWRYPVTPDTNDSNDRRPKAVSEFLSLLAKASLARLKAVRRAAPNEPGANPSPQETMRAGINVTRRDHLNGS